MTADPALAFWLRYAEAEGALHEHVGAATTVLLPDRLQTAFDLPEELAVTADPEVAREDGALLLAQGHPALDGAAERVLERGDVGRVTLAWPSASLPSVETFIEKLREHVQVDHGRIDAAGEPPVATYLPVLRVGALVTYTVTLDDRFQERQEAWVDAVTSLPLPASVSVAIGKAARSDVSAHRVLPADRDAAAAAAQALLEQAAGRRLAVLSRSSHDARDAEVTRVRDYYRAALESLARRRATAPTDRQQMLDSRADVTRAERERRLGEVEEKFRGSADARWFRAHELLVPAVTIPVTIRRGRREYPYSFRWLLTMQAVAPFRCPHCGAGSPLVAGKDKLGCERCLPSRAPSSDPRPGPGPQHRPLPAQGRTPAPVPDPKPAPAASGAARSIGASPVTGPPKASKQIRPQAVQAPDPKRLADAGNKLALKFWEDVAGDDRRVARLVIPGSPADVTIKLWGARGPAIAVSVPFTEFPRELDAQTAPEPDSSMQATGGWLRTAERMYPYTLRWQGGPGRPGVTQVAEVVAGRAGSGVRLSPSLLQSWWRTPWRVQALPRLRIDLDPVSAALWDVELTGRGFPLLTRCLAAWWRVGAMPAGADVPAVAAALARIVAAGAGTQVTFDTAAGQYGAEPAAVRAAGADLRRSLQLLPDRGW